MVVAFCLIRLSLQDTTQHGGNQNSQLHLLYFCGLILVSWRFMKLLVFHEDSLSSYFRFLLTYLDPNNFIFLDLKHLGILIEIIEIVSKFWFLSFFFLFEVVCYSHFTRFIVLVQALWMQASFWNGYATHGVKVGKSTLTMYQIPIGVLQWWILSVRLCSLPSWITISTWSIYYPILQVYFNLFRWHQLCQLKVFARDNVKRLWPNEVY